MSEQWHFIRLSPYLGTVACLMTAEDQVSVSNPVEAML